MYWVRADGSGEAQRLFGDGMQGIPVPRSFSPDGRRLAFRIGSEVWTAPMEGDSEHPRLGTATRFADASSSQLDAEYSPDGRWMAYVSNQSGVANVFVQSFPGPGGKWQISNGGGRFPIWSHNQHELFFLAPDQRIMVTPYTVAGNSFAPGTPRVWSQKRLGDVGVDTPYDLAPDGKRFAVILDAEEAGGSRPVTSVTIVLNFFDDLKRRVPAGGK